MPKTLLLSIKPAFADLIFAGTKTVELRRTRPNVIAGDTLAIYVSSPSMILKGFARIRGVSAGTPTTLWRRHGAQTGIDRRTFVDYFDGATMAYGIMLTDVRLLAETHSLKSLRNLLPGFTPPQVYRYLNQDHAELLGLPDLRGHRAA